jgi:hypothetical protein
MSNVAGMLGGGPNGSSLAAFARPGGWNDMSLLLNPGMGSGANLMSLDRSRAQFGLHCIFNANMLLTGNLSALDPFVLATWGNAEAVAINQDTAYTFVQLPLAAAAAAGGRAAALGLQPARVAECGGEPAAQNWTFGAVAPEFLSNGRTCVNAANCGTQLVFDGCTTSGRTCNPPGSFANQQFVLAPSGALVSALPGARRCATAAPDGTLSLEACASPPGAAQAWRYTPASGELALVADGRCLTLDAPPPPQWPSLMLGRRLADDSWALLALNNGNETAPLACAADCLAAMGFPAGATLKIRDVWARADLAPDTELLLPAPPNGGTAFWRVALQ